MSVQRVVKAVEYIERNILEEIDVRDVAAAACYSYYHFLRIFHAYTGFTVGAYIRRRRLTIAAEKLCLGSSVLSVALDAGFETQASFSRAFKSMFGDSPASFRRSNSRPLLCGQGTLTSACLSHVHKGEITMNPRIEHREAFTVIGIGRDATYGTFMGPVWDAFLSRADQVTGRLGEEWYGVCYAAVQGNQTDLFHYTAGVRVADSAPVPAGMEKVHVPARKYAVFTHKGPVTEILKTVDHIWKTWLPQSGMEPADSPDFELYDTRFKEDDPSSVFEIYVPLA